MLEKILQATGNMFWPMMFQLISTVMNMASGVVGCKDDVFTHLYKTELKNGKDIS